MKYVIRKAAVAPALRGDWDGEAWSRADTADIAEARPESSDHRPRTRVRLLYDTKGIYGTFRVEDQYVRCTRTQFQDSVCRDSCAEFFVKPHVGAGYFNFEFNCGGAFLASYIADHTRTPEGFRDCMMLPADDGESIRVYHSMPSVVEPEIREPTVWTIEFFIPFALFAKYAGTLGDVSGREWRANFYKCADETSHPHWLSWAPLSARNFHLPDCFDALMFEV